MELSKLAFLETYQFEDNSGLMGAILVTDADTKPIEFRVTAPIKPTNFQKTLYGEVLLEHVLVELIGVPLLSAVNEEIDLILVKDPLFLGVNNKQGTRVVRILKDTGDEPKGAKITEELKNNAVPQGKIFMQIPKKFENEMAEIKERLNQIAESRNLLEPFERLKLACQQVHLQKTGE